jgi:uncharacterized pyridoxamine 5'-phosphate oxidase family protein
MFDYESALKASPNGVFATRNGDGVGTRVFQFLFADGNKVYFCTSNQKPVYEQISQDPNVSFCTHSDDFSSVVSVNGKVVIVDDMSLKARALDENPAIKEIYGAPDNPVFTLLYIDVKSVDTFSFTDGANSYAV